MAIYFTVFAAEVKITVSVPKGNMTHDSIRGFSLWNKTMYYEHNNALCCTPYTLSLNIGPDKCTDNQIVSGIILNLNS